jgi:hypothetical protein
VRRWAKADVGLAVRAAEKNVDTVVSVALEGASGTHSEERTVFLGGAEGRRRAAIAACAVLLEWLRRA